MPEYPPTYAETYREEVATPAAPTAVAPATPAAGVVRTSTYVGSPAYRAVQLVWFICGVVELFIGLRVLFRALAANQANAFVQFCSDVADPFVAPFRGIVRDYGLHNGGVLESGSLIAMAVYVVAAALVAMLVRILVAPRRPVAA